MNAPFTLTTEPTSVSRRRQGAILKEETSLRKVRACVAISGVGVLACACASFTMGAPWGFLWTIPSGVVGWGLGVSLAILTFERAKLK